MMVEMRDRQGPGRHRNRTTMRTKASTKTETRSKKFLFEKRRPAPKNCGRPRGGLEPRLPPFQQQKPTRKKRRGLSFSTKQKEKGKKKKKEEACQRKLERRQNFVERLFALNNF
ncbi:hypothetical protein V6Z11_D05G218300 [Gossypium hirsutum]